MEANPRLSMSTPNPDTISSSNPSPEPLHTPFGTLYVGADEVLGSTTSTNAQQASGNSSSVPMQQSGSPITGPERSKQEELLWTIFLLSARMDSLNSSVLRQIRELKALKESMSALRRWVRNVGQELEGNS
jgi:hypothetical protein